MRAVVCCCLLGLLIASPAVAAQTRPCLAGEIESCGPAGCCGPGEFCAPQWRQGSCPREGVCRAHLPLPRGLVFSLPIPAGEQVYCAKGSLKTGLSTHSACDSTTRFAVDLASTAAERPHFVTASADGVAVVFGGCPTSDLNRQGTPSPCNLGFGNIVRVEHARGLYSQVAHLSSLLVHDGKRVRRGDILGLEGNSGNAGGKHLHWSLHRGSARVMLPGPSLPFPSIRLRRGGQLMTLSGLALPCGDFQFSAEPDPRSLLESENVVGQRPPLRFGFLRRIDELAIDAVSPHARTRHAAIGELREMYHQPTAAYWIGLGYLRGGDGRTAAKELRYALRRSLQGEGPPWLRAWCLVFLGEITLSQGRTWDARDLFNHALTVSGHDVSLRARAQRGIAQTNGP